MIVRPDLHKRIEETFYKKSVLQGLKLSKCIFSSDLG